MEQTVMTNALMSTVQNGMIFNKVHHQTSQLGISFNIKVWTLQPGTLVLQCVKNTPNACAWEHQHLCKYAI